MYVYRTENVDPTFNLATEEFLTKSSRFNEPILFLWQNQNTIVVGRNQNTSSEINLQAALKDKVIIVRRNTGGGTVFHDLGNLNFSLIYTSDSGLNFDTFTKTISPIVECLNELGIEAKIEGKNDIKVKGFKISGNAMWKHGNRMLHHGTLLFNSDLNKIKDYLLVDKSKMEIKKIQSVVSKVANINDFADKKLSIPFFMEYLINYFSAKNSIKQLILDQKDIKEIEKLADSKYCDDEWTYDKHANFAYSNKIRFINKGAIEVNLEIKEGSIIDCKIYGDFLGFLGTEKLEEMLIGEKYKVENINEVLKKINIKETFGDPFEIEDILSVLIQ